MSGRDSVWVRAGQRLVDLLLSYLLLVALLPLLLLLAVAVKLCSRGPVLVAMKRVGRNGRRIGLLELRTTLAGEDGQLTRLGRFLRTFSLDKLPSLFNLLVGDVSLFGPRPVPAEEVEPCGEDGRGREQPIDVAEESPVVPPVVTRSNNGGSIIQVCSASVRYRTYKSRRRSLREAVFRSVMRRDERVDVWALKDVSFQLPRGESLGVIGANGAGKSTLCLLLSQIMAPTEGEVFVDGRVSALLTLGAGFQGDLTGRDNVFLNGIYLGHSMDQMREKFREILAFSELEDVIDQPVRTYSSGMRARLAFSIAASVQPEILIIDELMGVGDRKFQAKSTARMKEMVASSKALVVVSHSMGTIRDLCTRAIWLDRGRLMAEGPTEEVIAAYEAS